MVVQSNTKIVERILNCKQVPTRSGSGDICKIMILCIFLLEIEEGVKQLSSLIKPVNVSERELLLSHFSLVGRDKIRLGK